MVSAYDVNALWFGVALVFLILALLAAFFIFLYLLFWKPTVPSVPCSNDSKCGPTETCVAGVCTQLTCNVDADCNISFDNGRCVNGRCYALTCINGNDCPSGTACVNSGTTSTPTRTCVTVGANCINNTECKGLTCAGGTCVQCTVNSECGLGQSCENGSTGAGICRFPVTGETIPGLINIPSVGQANGNILAPAGFFCPADVCAQSPGFSAPIVCSSSVVCPDSCPFCVNNVCRCAPGLLYEPCINDTDCGSNICSVTAIGRICAPPGGQCAFNYKSAGPPIALPILGSCPAAAPYCLQSGVCSTSSLGAICGSPGLPTDMCVNSESLTGTPALPNTGGLFCVNSTCQNIPGPLNARCAGTACLTLNPASFVCSSPFAGQPLRCQSLA